MKALSIRKNECEDQVRPAFGSSYAANMTSAAIDHEVQRQLELVRRSSVEQEIKRRVQHEMQMASFYATMPFHSLAIGVNCYYCSGSNDIVCVKACSMRIICVCKCYVFNLVLAWFDGWRGSRIITKY